MNFSAPTSAEPTVMHMFAKAVTDAPHAEALVCQDIRLSYAEYGACVGSFCAELCHLGIGPGHRVATVMKNSADAAIATFAILATGAQLVPLNPGYTKPELEIILDDAEVSGIVIDEGIAGLITGITTKDVTAIVVGANAKRLTVPALTNFVLPPMPDPASLSTLQYTGGTTGRPKGVNLTHRAIATNISQRQAMLPAQQGDRILVVPPLFHVYAVSMGLYFAVQCSGVLHIVPKFDAAEVLRLIETENITAFPASPTLIQGLMRDPGFQNTDFSSLRLVASGSAPLPLQVLLNWEAVTLCPILEAYGQTEAGPVLTSNAFHAERRAGTVGTKLRDTEIEIVDLESGTQVLAQGEEGEIRARGPQLMAGYRNRPTETAAALRDGWLYTGDIGRLDADGYLTICDRKKDMVVSAGFNVYPREVEDVLMQHAAITAAAVIGVPDAYRGEVLRAYVSLSVDSLDEATIIAHAARQLAKYKLPTSVVIMDALPLTNVGKIDKQKLRQISQKHSA